MATSKIPNNNVIKAIDDGNYGLSFSIKFHTVVVPSNGGSKTINFSSAFRGVLFTSHNTPALMDMALLSGNSAGTSLQIKRVLNATELTLEVVNGGLKITNNHAANDWSTIVVIMGWQGNILSVA